MNRNILVLSSILLLGILIIPAHAESANHVVINEVDVNPNGSDAQTVSEWVEIYNPTDSKIDIGNWKIASTTVLKKTMTISPGTFIEPGQFLTYSYQSLWFTDISESVELLDENGVLIDKTPPLSDLKDDFTSWQRIYDGYDLDSVDDWHFVVSTAGSTNGKQVVTSDSEIVSVSISADKSDYLFGETAILQGSVSEEIFVEKPFFTQEQILINISGPNFYKNITLYPDLNLNFETTLNLQRVLGINEGEYFISVSYEKGKAETSFSVGNQIIQQITKESSALSLGTDKFEYIPGDTVKIFATSTEITPFEGLKFRVFDPNRNQIYDGTLFPTADVNTINEIFGKSDFEGGFLTTIFLSPINPVYGTYQIVADYVENSADFTFELTEDVKEDVAISLWTDKDVYGIGDTVIITGRSNYQYVDSLDIVVVQTKSTALGVKEVHEGGDFSFKLLDSVRLAGDSTFEYSFQIPDGTNLLGDYKIDITKDIGSASKVIHVVEDPESYVPVTEPLTISIDKSVYVFGDKMEISGFVSDVVIPSSYQLPSVTISFFDSDGNPLEILGLPKEAKTRTYQSIDVGYEFTIVPDLSGRFSVMTEISRLIFSEDTFVIKAEYQTHTASTSFQVKDYLTIGDTTIHAELDKEVYGLGEVVNLSGVFAAQTHDAQGITMTIHKPNGDTDKSGTTIEDGLFSWSWNTPIGEYVTLDQDTRSTIHTNFGVYRINVETQDNDVDLFFLVSPDPENDKLDLTSFIVDTEKEIYKPGEKLKVFGTVLLREQGSQGLVIPDRVHISVVSTEYPFPEIHESNVYPNHAGEFSSNFEIPATLFGTGLYKVKADYNGKHFETTFSVASDYVFGIDDPVALLVSIDKEEYYPGDVVTVTGKLNKLVFLFDFQLSVINKTETEITCGSFDCGKHLGNKISVRPSPSGSFSYQIPIPMTNSLGEYEITVDVGFDTKYVSYKVVEKPVIVEPIVDETPVVEEKKSPKTIIEKVNRIPDNFVSVQTSDKVIDENNVSPRVLSGSLISPARGDESIVNLRVSSESGICVIGPEENCLVKDSTRGPGKIYDIVEVDDMSLKVRYSGPDVRLEKFNILPESSSEFLPNTSWNIEVIKDEQASRLYHKISYKSLE